MTAVENSKMNWKNINEASLFFSEQTIYISIGSYLKSIWSSGLVCADFEGHSIVTALILWWNALGLSLGLFSCCSTTEGFCLKSSIVTDVVKNWEFSFRRLRPLQDHALRRLLFPLELPVNWEEGHGKGWSSCGCFEPCRACSWPLAWPLWTSWSQETEAQEAAKRAPASTRDLTEWLPSAAVLYGDV